jgi:hypothetical protein
MRKIVIHSKKKLLEVMGKYMISYTDLATEAEIPYTTVRNFLRTEDGTTSFENWTALSVTAARIAERREANRIEKAKASALTDTEPMPDQISLE